MPVPLILLEDVWRVYNHGASEVVALRGVTVTIEQGEFVAVMGASGSGKSTFLNILGCLDRPTRGRYVLNGRDVTGLSADERAEIRNREIGFVFQNFNLLPRATAVENVELPLFYGPLPYAEQRPRALAALGALGLAERAFHYPNQLSGGQQQRVAIARALVSEPSLLLADEPTGNLDSAASRDLMELLVRLNAQRGVTVVVVTHEPDVAAYARRVVHFRDGSIVSDRFPRPTR
ncbi:MAG: ABC transporter ATP-binding protein [Candidatus Binatia bacterium]|nr:MAG: ABC transporter ATP-binding protein [Candidatus Binatia bacterium]